MSYRLRNWFPAGMSAFTLVVFLLAYPPEIFHANLTTAVLSACAALGWSALILYVPAGTPRRLAVHLLAATVLPPLMRLLPATFPWVFAWHWSVYGLMLFSFAGLYGFVRAQSRRSREQAQPV